MKSIFYLGDNLLLRRTQDDLLQKLRQLQEWRQQKEEHLLQDKEKQLSVLRDKERRLHAIQEYQRKILQSNNLVASGVEGGPFYPIKHAGFNNGFLPRPSFRKQGSENELMSPNGPAKTALLSPQHFKSKLPNMVGHLFSVLYIDSLINFVDSI